MVILVHDLSLHQKALSSSFVLPCVIAPFIPMLPAGTMQLANLGSADMEQLLQGANLQELTLGNQLLMPGGMDTAMAGPQATLLRLLDSPAFLEQVAAGMQALQGADQQQVQQPQQQEQQPQGQQPVQQSQGEQPREQAPGQHGQEQPHSEGSS